MPRRAADIAWEAVNEINTIIKNFCYDPEDDDD